MVSISKVTLMWSYQLVLCSSSGSLSLVRWSLLGLVLLDMVVRMVVLFVLLLVESVLDVGKTLNRASKSMIRQTVSRARRVLSRMIAVIVVVRLIVISMWIESVTRHPQPGKLH